MSKQIGHYSLRLAVPVAALMGVLASVSMVIIMPGAAQPVHPHDGTTSASASVSDPKLDSRPAPTFHNLVRFVAGVPVQLRTTKAESRMSLPSWAAMHNKHVERAKKGNIGVVFYGDSITELMEQDRQLFDKYFSKFRSEPFGIGGDRTEHLLWRLQNGELNGFVPKVAVVLIGTNNLSADKEHEIALGVEAVISEIRGRSPDTKILLLGLLPRGQSAKDPFRARLKKVNNEITKLADQKHVWYQDIGDRLVDKDGNISEEIMPDFLHPSAKGYQIIYEAVQPQVARLFK